MGAESPSREKPARFRTGCNAHCRSLYFGTPFLSTPFKFYFLSGKISSGGPENAPVPDSHILSRPGARPRRAAASRSGGTRRARSCRRSPSRRSRRGCPACVVRTQHVAALCGTRPWPQRHTQRNERRGHCSPHYTPEVQSRGNRSVGPSAGGASVQRGCVRRPCAVFAPSRVNACCCCYVRFRCLRHACGMRLAEADS